MIPVRDEALYVCPPTSCLAGAGAVRCVRLWMLGGASARAFSTDDDEACVRHAPRVGHDIYSSSSSSSSSEIELRPSSLLLDGDVAISAMMVVNERLDMDSSCGHKTARTMRESAAQRCDRSPDRSAHLEDELRHLVVLAERHERAEHVDRGGVG
jgi:hypothetical protein